MSVPPPRRRYLVLGLDETATSTVRDRLVAGGVAPQDILVANDASLPRSDSLGAIVAALDPDEPLPELQTVVSDLLENVHLQARLATAARDLRLLEAAIAQAQDAMVITDARIIGDGPRVHWVNQAFCDLVGVRREALLGTPVADVALLGPARRRLLTSLRRRHAFDGAVHLGDAELARHLEVSIGPVRDGATVEHFVGVVRDVTEKKRVEDRLTHLAHHDHLTGLPNRKLLRDRLEHALTRSRRFEEPIGVVFMDLDGFKGINDTLGHAAGDRVLEVVAERLSQTVRASDTVARLGGDEFVLLLPGIGSVDNAERVADKVVEKVSEPIRVEDQELVTTPSLGVAVWPDHGDDAAALMRHADQAMYHAKATGKATWVTWTRALDAEEHRRAELVADLAEATAQGQLHLDCAVIWDVAGDRTAALEVSVRWTHPARGPVSPATFLPLLGEAGVEDALLDWTVARLGQAPPDVVIAMDARAAWLRDPNLGQRLIDALADVGVLPERLWLEVAEGTLIQLDGRERDALQQLRERGVSVVVDHYGTSHLSLPQLRTLPLDAVKLDHQLLRRVVEDDALVRGLVTLCQSLDLTVIADGISTVEERDALAALGLHHQQGSLWGTPQPLATLLRTAT
jgi:diguanylate cyclase (GGDEF)-like protein/PAS domain S-box-containing protein